MNGTQPSGLRRLLAGEFERRGWEWDLSEGGTLVEGIVDSGDVDAQRLARRLSSTYLQRIGASREDIAEAIESAVGGRVPTPGAEQGSVTMILNDNRHQLNMGTGARVVDSQVNVSGTQINVRADSPKEDVMAGVAALVRAGLNNDWNPEAARELAEVVDTREDVALADVEAVAEQVIGEEAVEAGRAREMLQAITEQGLGGALAVGIVKALALAIGAL